MATPWEDALARFDRLKHALKNPSRVEKALTALPEAKALPIFRGTDEDIISRLAAYDEENGEVRKGGCVTIHCLFRGKEDKRLKRLCELVDGRINFDFLEERASIDVLRCAISTEDKVPELHSFEDMPYRGGNMSPQTFSDGQHVWLDCKRRGAPWYVQLFWPELGMQRAGVQAH